MGQRRLRDLLPSNRRRRRSPRPPSRRLGRRIMNADPEPRLQPGTELASNTGMPKGSAGVPPALAGASRPHAPLWATLTATFLGIGRLHPGPGTWGSAATVAPLGRRRLRTSAVASNSARHRSGRTRHPDRHPRRHTRCPRLRQKRSPIRRHRRSRRTTHRPHRRPSRVENFSRRFYTFQSVRYRQAAPRAATGAASRRHRHRARRRGRRNFALVAIASPAPLWSTK